MGGAHAPNGYSSGICSTPLFEVGALYMYIHTYICTSRECSSYLCSGSCAAEDDGGIKLLYAKMSKAKFAQKDEAITKSLGER